MAIYIGIMVVGFLAIVIIWLGENKSQKTSAVDLLNSLEVDENPETPRPSAKPSTSFLNRLSMENDKPKAAAPKPAEQSAQTTLDRSAAEFESKLGDADILKEDPESEKLKDPEETV